MSAGLEARVTGTESPGRKPRSMRFFTARRLALAALIPALLLVSVVPGCSNQGEGERCGDTVANNDDCQSGLVCVEIKSQSTPTAPTFRCCNPNHTIINDSRCEDNASGTTNPDAGTGGGGTSGSGGEAGMSSGGSSGSAGSGDGATAGAAGDSGSAAGAAGSN